MTTIKKKAASAIAAVGVAAAVALGGTFAWQSISQTALNEASDVVNPGGRLHDDFDGTNKDVYVENFADEPIFARIRLAEYFEIIANYGVEGAEKSTSILGSKSVVDGKTVYDYAPFGFDGNVGEGGVVSAGLETTGTGEAATTHSWWSWQTGGSKVYMPTFNKNKDSLAADVNGVYEEGNVGTISNRDGSQYTDYVDYSLPENATKTGAEVYDADANSVDEGEGAVEGTNITTVAGVEHTAKLTGDATLMSMADWIDAGSKPGEYWVYDADGWVYWAQAIPGRNEDGTTNATGLLLDSIELNQVMDDTWYYAIDVTAQFITADDLGEPGAAGEDGQTTAGTGFYADGLSDEAIVLLAAIGVDVGEAATPTFTVLGADGAVLGKDLAAGAKISVMECGEIKVVSSDPTTTWTVKVDAADPVTATSLVGDDGRNVLSYADFGNAEAGTEITFTQTTRIGKEASLTVVVTEYDPIVALKSAPTKSTVEIDGIDWYVLAQDEKNNRALIWAADVIEVDESGGKVMGFGTASNKWSESSIREYLNETWLNAATLPTLHDAAAQVSLSTRVVTFDNNTSTATSDFATTEDKVFLLSEADLFGSVQPKFPGGYENAVAGDYTYVIDGTGQRLAAEGEDLLKCKSFTDLYWLRSSVGVPGQGFVGLVNGGQGVLGAGSYGRSYGVRPALWVNLGGSGDDSGSGSGGGSDDEPKPPVVKKCGESVTYSLNEGGRLVLSGTGETYIFGEGALTPFESEALCEYVTSIEVREGITTIGVGLFRGLSNVESVTLPSSLTSIGASSFSGCLSLKEISIPSGVKSIGISAFSGCTALGKVALSSGLETIGARSFQNCSSLGEIIVPSGVTSIGEYAFQGCASLESVYLPSTLTNIGSAALDTGGETLTVHYAGTRQDWAPIGGTTAVPTGDNVKVVFESASTEG